MAHTESQQKSPKLFHFTRNFPFCVLWAFRHLNSYGTIMSHSAALSSSLLRFSSISARCCVLLTLNKQISSSSLPVPIPNLSPSLKIYVSYHHHFAKKQLQMLQFSIEGGAVSLRESFFEFSPFNIFYRFYSISTTSGLEYYPEAFLCCVYALRFC